MKRELNVAAGSTIRTVDSKNEYRVIDRIGDGGNSAVLAAVVTRGPLQGALVAFRVFSQLENAQRLTRFRQEGEFLRETMHPAIVGVLEVGEARISGKDGTKIHPYQVQKLYGAPLSVALRGDIPIIYRVLWTIQLLSALRHLSTLSDSVVHRDIKPANIFLDGTTAVLADFGMMKLSSETKEVDEFDPELLRTKMPKAYRTPDLVEYVRTGTTPTPKSDVFQLGLVVAEIFFNRNPLKRADIDADIELEALPERQGTHFPRIKALVERMLVVDSNDRELPESLLDDWDGVLHSIADGYGSLEGRVLPRRW
jgi:serine/threonine protein kinase